MTVDEMFKVLRKVPFLSDIPATELAMLARSARSLSRKRGEMIFQDGSDAESCFIFVSGRGKVVLSGSDGAEVILGTVEPLELAGELALLDASRRSAGLVAMKASEIIELPRASFLTLRNNRAFEDKLMLHVVVMLRRATERLRAITYDAEDRVFWCLARAALRMGTRVDGKIIISPKPSQQDLADMMGYTRETVSRRLSELRKTRRIRATASAYILDEKDVQNGPIVI